ncbi:hypothetical protein [Marinobacter salicampi]|uniref:hypothetical protein n=1 Tax=Marinobacter salicampi TaxID=435907 RepID=UPI00140879D2|nr:hypothetical protein [Marinobacter salicampi]
MAVILAMGFSASLQAQDSLDTRDHIRMANQGFMTKAVKNDVRGAYQELRPLLGVAADPYDKSATEAVSYFERVNDTVGNAVGHSHVKTEVIGDDFTRETWLHKFDAAAIAWQFTYYQAEDDGWKLVGVSYSTEVEDLYQEP